MAEWGGLGSAGGILSSPLPSLMEIQHPSLHPLCWHLLPAQRWLKRRREKEKRAQMLCFTWRCCRTACFNTVLTGVSTFSLAIALARSPLDYSSRLKGDKTDVIWRRTPTHILNHLVSTWLLGTHASDARQEPG